MGAAMSHDDLAADLAAHLRTEKRMVWTNLQLGPAGSPRPDVYAIYKSFAAPAPMAYEVKVSVADFRADVTAGKWHSYLAYASGVVFAVESSLGIGRADVPPSAGLIVRGEKGWRAAKKAALNPVVVPQDALLKLLIDGVEREGPRHRARRFLNSYGYGSSERVGLKLGAQVAACVADHQSGESELRSARLRAEEIVQRAKREAEDIRASVTAMAPLWDELCAVLGLRGNASRWEIEQAVRGLREEVRETPAAREYRTLTQILRRALDAHGYREHVQEPAATEEPELGEMVDA